MNYGYIYLTTNTINNKKYIGQHMSDKFDESYKGSGVILKKAFEKYGFENFCCEILEWADTKEHLNLLEKTYIDKYNAVNSDEFYNLIPGGTGNSESGIFFVNDGINNKKIHDYELENYLADGYVIGRTSPTEETIRNRANSNRGKKRTKESCNKISEALKGRKFSEEHKQALRKPKSTNNWRKGLITVHKDDDYINISPNDLEYYLSNGYERGAKKHSKDSSAKHRDAVIGRVYVTNEIICKHPKLEDLNYYLELGWRIGRPKK